MDGKAQAAKALTRPGSGEEKTRSWPILIGASHPYCHYMQALCGTFFFPHHEDHAPCTPKPFTPFTL